jgi:hypothetical protein
MEPLNNTLLKMPVMITTTWELSRQHTLSG